MEKAALEYLIEHPLENVTATIVIKDALMFRIAKSPIKKTIEKYGLSNHCPTCGRMGIGGFHYCPDCGQAIKWE